MLKTLLMEEGVDGRWERAEFDGTPVAEKLSREVGNFLEWTHFVRALEFLRVQTLIFLQ